MITRILNKILNKIFNNKKLKFLLPFLSTLFLIIPGGFAYAGMGSSIGSFFVSLIGLIIYLFALVAIELMQIGGRLLSAVITFTFNDKLFIEAPFVKTMWGFTRDLTNIFFIVWLVLIAMATIVDYKGYQAKRLLPRLIIVAILVNFSLVLCGVILDLGQGVMGFLTQGVITIHGEPYGLAEGLVMAFRQSELFGAKLPSFGSFFGNFNAAVNTVMQNSLVLVFSGIAAYTFIILAVMMLVRVGALWLLLIFAPLTWVVGIMPFGKKVFNEWMSNFWKWAFYGVVVAFFLYLAAMAVWAIQESSWQKDNFGNPSLMAGQFGTNVSFLENFSSLLSFMVVMILLLMAKGAGTKAAKSGGDMVTGAVAGFIGGKVASFRKKSKDRVIQKKDEYKDKAKERIGSKLMDSKINQRLGRLPIVGGAINRKLARSGAKMRSEAIKGQAKRISKAQDYSNLTKEERLKLIPNLRGVELEKAMQTMIKNDEIQKLDKNKAKDYEALQRMYNIAKKSGNENLKEDFERKRFDMITDPSSYTLTKGEAIEVATSNNPLLSQQIQQRKQQEAGVRSKEVLEKAIKKGELKNEDFVNNLSPEQLTEVLKNKDAAKAIGKASEDWIQTVKDSVLEKIQTGFSDNFDKTTDKGDANVKLRKLYAKMSGDYNKAFTTNNRGQTETNPFFIDDKNRLNVLSEEISKINRQSDWEKINDSSENMKLLAEHMTASQVSNAGGSLDAQTKQKIFEENILLREDPNILAGDRERLEKVYTAMLKNDTWPGSYGDIEKAEKEKEKMNDLHVEAHIENIRRDRQKENKMRDEANKMNEEYDINYGRMHSEAKRMNEEYDKEKERKEERGKNDDSNSAAPSGDGHGPSDKGGPNTMEPDKTIELVQDDDETWQVPGEKGRFDSGENFADSSSGSRGTTNIQEGTINTESADINANEVNIHQTPEAPTQTAKPARTSSPPKIKVPKPRGNVKFSSGSGWTPQQKKDVDERREAKYRESIKKKQEVDNKKTIKNNNQASGKERKQGKENDLNNLGRSSEYIAIKQAKEGSLEDAINTANTIKDPEKHDQTLGEIASIMIDKNNIDGAFTATRHIENEKIRKSAISEIMRRSDNTYKKKS